MMVHRSYDLGRHLLEITLKINSLVLQMFQLNKTWKATPLELNVLILVQVKSLTQSIKQPEINQQHNIQLRAIHKYIK